MFPDGPQFVEGRRSEVLQTYALVLARILEVVMVLPLEEVVEKLQDLLKDLQV